MSLRKFCSQMRLSTGAVIVVLATLGMLLGTVPAWSQVVPPPPTINNFTPNTGAPGTSVVITGQNFNDVRTVSFGGALASYTVSGPGQITATVPTSAVTGPITVTTGAGSANSATFIVVAGTLTDVQSPVGTSNRSGIVGDTREIIGTGFANATAVSFNATGAIFTVVSATRITAIVPVGASTGPVRVITPAGTITSPFFFTITVPVPTATPVPTPTATPGLPPSITDVQFPVGTQNRSGVPDDTRFITGQNFTGATAVTYNNTPAIFAVISNTQIQTLVPAGFTTGPIRVTTPGGVAASPFFFTLITPTPTPTFTPAPTATPLISPGALGLEVSPDPIFEASDAGEVISVTLNCASQSNADRPPTAEVNVKVKLTAVGNEKPITSPEPLVFPAGACGDSVTLPVAMDFTGSDDVQDDTSVSVSISTTSQDANYAGLSAGPKELQRLDQHGAFVSPPGPVFTSETDQRTGRTSGFQLGLFYVGTLQRKNGYPIAAGDLKPKSEVFVTVQVQNGPGQTGGDDEAKIFTDTQRIPNTSQILVFDQFNYTVPQNIYVQGLDDSDMDGDRLYTVIVTDVVSGDPEYSNHPLHPGNIMLNVDDEAQDNEANELPGVLITPSTGTNSPLPTNESGSTSVFRVRLNSRPTANVVVNLVSSRTDEGRVSPPSLTFTSSNWDTAQQVTVTGVNDAVQDGDQDYRIITTVVSNDTNYGGDPTKTPATPPIDPMDIFLVNQDDEVAGFTVNPGVLILSEGAQQPFTVRLNRQPSNDVVLNLSSGNLAAVAVDKTRLSFTNTDWNIPQTVTVRAFDNFTRNVDQNFSIILSPSISADTQYNGLDPADVTGVVLDNEVADITVTQVGQLRTTEAGGTATFSVRLTSQPTDTVSLDLSTSDPTEGTVQPTNLTFDDVNWSTPQVVTVTGVDDAILDGDVTYRIVSSSANSGDRFYSGLKMPDVVVINTDDEAGFILSSTSITTTEGGPPETITLRLNSAPTANVVIGLSSSDTTEGTVSPASLTFTPANFATPQAIRVTPVDDILRDGNITYTIRATITSNDTGYASSTVPTITVVNRDNDVPGITITPLSASLTEGGRTAFTVKLNSKPAQNVTLNMSPSDATQISLDKTSLVFTTTNFGTAQTVNATAIDDMKKEQTLAYTVVTAPLTSTDANYSGLNPPDVRLLVADNDIASVVVSPLSGLRTSEKGGTATFTVRLTSQPASSVQVTVASTDLGEGTVDKVTLFFTNTTNEPVSGTTSGWNVQQTVKVTGVDDTVEDGDVAFAVTTRVSSSDAYYNGFRTQNVVVVNADDGDDRTPPTVAFVQPGANSVQRTLTYATGTATDNKGLARVVLRIFRYGDTTRAAGYVAANGAITPTYVPATHDLTATGTTSWILRLPALVTGRYDIRATSIDKVGNQTAATRTFFIDQIGPNAQLTTPAPSRTHPANEVTQATGRIVEAGGGTVASASLVLFRYASTAAGQSAGYYNGTGFQGTQSQVALTVAANGSFTLPLPLLTIGNYYIQLLSVDNFGNSNRTGLYSFAISQATAPAPTATPTTVPTGSPTAAPTPTPTTVPGVTFDMTRSSYLLSVPHSDAAAKTSSTTVAKAFTTPPTATDGAVNYRLRQYDPVSQNYVELGNSSVLVRGRAYFLEPVLTGTSLRLPSTDASRKALTDATFDITLVRNPSLPLSDPNNGLNLIGFPFDPARFTSASWSTATIIADGTTYSSPAAASAVMYPELYEFDESRGGYFAATSLQPYKGYAVRTKVNGVIVRLTGTP